MLKREIISAFKCSKLKWKEQTVRDNVSRFKIKYCSSCTQNAAAYILGLAKDVKIWQKLDRVDRESLPPNVSDIVERYVKKSNNPGKRKPHEKEVIIKKVGRTSPYDFHISSFNLHEGLTEDCGSSFKKPFRVPIREALLNLEEHIRTKINSNEDGHDLITEAKKRNVFKRAKPSESQGLYFLYSGAIMWLRNPPNHRKMKYGKEEALKIIMFTDYLIQLFDQLCSENNIN